jgi:hypothetical protein
MLATVVLTHVVLFKTTIGLRIRACGEHPRAADTVGISVYRVRYAAVVTSGALAALGGAFLSLGFVGSFSENMTVGKGYIALAAVIFGKWRPGWAFAATLLFGFGYALAIPLQREADISSALIATLPYVLTLVAVAGLIGRSIRLRRSASRTSSSSVARATRRPLRVGALVSGAASVATLPVAIYATRFSDSYELLHAGLAIPRRRRSACSLARAPRATARRAGLDGAAACGSRASRALGLARPRGRRPRVGHRVRAARVRGDAIAHGPAHPSSEEQIASTRPARVRHRLQPARRPRRQGSTSRSSSS